MSHMIRGRNFIEVHNTLQRMMVLQGESVHTGTWQGRDISTRPEMVTTELLNVNLNFPLNGEHALDHWRAAIKPNLPWADDHFAERVCGKPINPGIEWANWPWGKSANTFREQGLFNHNYMERYWPKRAGEVQAPTQTASEWERRMAEPWRTNVLPRMGIRGEYGDLNDLVDLLGRDPLTRQAYLPIYFPEDTGADGRKPCTLGYQFILRNGKLHCFYPMRSCDLVRHFQDDVYLTIRLMLWILEQLDGRSPVWSNVSLGSLDMHMTSLHCFANDMIQLRKTHG